MANFRFTSADGKRVPVGIERGKLIFAPVAPERIAELKTFWWEQLRKRVIDFMDLLKICEHLPD